MISHSSLHFTILDYILKKGHAPELGALAKLLEVDEAEVEKGLYDLQEYHGVVLHPKETKVWVIHPFSMAPTNFSVHSDRGIWWANCAWCAFGVATLLRENLRIHSSLAAYGEPVCLHIENGELQEKNLLVHFPIPMRKAWDNVVYTCSTMLLFRAEAEIDAWCRRHQIPKGDVQKVDKIWAFAQKWYGHHLDPNWKKWTLEEAREIFESFELSHDIWHLEGTDTRF